MKLPFPKEQNGTIRGRIFVVAFGILLAALVLYFQEFWGFIQKLGNLASPFFMGFAIAFLLGPVQRRLESALRFLIDRKKPHAKLTRFFSVLLSIVFLLLLVYVFIKIIKSWFPR